jgi:glyoxylase-like metal-dependent hydrolase (beta-lactamase superfamily II)
MAKKTGAKIVIHEKDAEALPRTPPYLLETFSATPSPPADVLVKEGDIIQVGKIGLQVIHTPGHSPGEMSLFWEQTGVLFSGDVIFPQGVGRTDFPGGDGSLLKASIERLRTYQPTMLLSGHGEIVSGREVVEKNFELVKRAYFGYL